ncbi:dTMP kinase [Desulfoscipio sp. XC116]|uniref:dTMP kinase n=1 Tax=Desulfoscipio sp. XC116 TaxID=3144975 RepID=UPI00325B849C
MLAGKFIVFEGIDGAGKTTQMELLAGFLKKMDIPVLCTREPGGTRIGGRLRELLLDPACHDISHRTEAFLYAADRAQHVDEIIRPALVKGITVLCDRFVYSTLAYQGWGRGMDMALLRQLNELATGALVPDAVVLLDITVREGISRVLGQRPPDRLEGEKNDFFRRVRDGYLEMALRWPGTFRVVEGDGPVEDVHRRILKAVGDLITP